MKQLKRQAAELTRAFTALANEVLEARRLLSAAPLNLLFFGNSFTNNTSDGSAYDMPATLKAIAVADGFSSPNVHEQILLGQTLADHLNKLAADGSNNIISAPLPAGQHWDDVVLQEYSTRPTNATALEGNVPLFRSDALQLFNDVRANSPAVHGVLYQTWARGSASNFYPAYFNGPADMQNQLLSNYNLAGGDINAADGAGSVSVSPAGEAWRNLNWQSSLYSTLPNDGVQYHPSTRGILLNAMVNFDTVYHAQVSTIPLANVSGVLSNLGLGNSDWTALAGAADAAVRANNPVTGGGTVAGVQATAAAGYNLTSLGTSDWTHWGRGNVARNFDHKSVGNSRISNVSRVGSGGYGSYYDSTRHVSWTDGAPLASDAGDDGYLWANNAIGAGYSFTVPAGTTSQTLYVYAGGYSSGATLTAHLSDGSAADFVGGASGNGIYSQLYSINFQAASAGQTLTITYTKTQNINGAGGSADLIAAALAGPAAPSGLGTLAGSQVTAASRYNLTSLGGGDWAHWGRGSIASNFDHKSSGGSQISNVARLGMGSFGSYYDTSRGVAWSDGSPLPVEPGDNAYLWANNAVGAGYSFVVPAGVVGRTLSVYAGGYSSGALLTAHLSDGSAADFVATASGSSIYSQLYTITFQAASANQTLTISYVKNQNINGVGGSADLIAAALQ